MTDRELLELAAKGAGYRTDHPWNTERLDMDPPVDALMIHNTNGGLAHTAWNPLTDDGDALRLAVKLGIIARIKMPRGAPMVAISFFCKAGRKTRQIVVIEAGQPDPYAATRRAIVRAAAEIARTQEQS